MAKKIGKKLLFTHKKCLQAGTLSSVKAPETFVFHQNILIRAEGLIPRCSASGLLITLMQHPHKNPSSVLLNRAIRTPMDGRRDIQ